MPLRADHRVAAFRPRRLPCTLHPTLRIRRRISSLLLHEWVPNKQDLEIYLHEKYPRSTWQENLEHILIFCHVHILIDAQDVPAMWIWDTSHARSSKTCLLLAPHEHVMVLIFFSSCAYAYTHLFAFLLLFTGSGVAVVVAFRHMAGLLSKTQLEISLFILLTGFKKKITLPFGGMRA